MIYLSFYTSETLSLPLYLSYFFFLVTEPDDFVFSLSLAITLNVSAATWRIVNISVG